MVPLGGDILECLVMFALVEELTPFIRQDSRLEDPRTHLAAVNYLVQKVVPEAMPMIKICDH